MFSKWGIENSRCLTFEAAQQILSSFAYSIYSDWYHDIWQHKETGLYTLTETYFDWGARFIKRILAENITLEQLDSFLCHECPFYGEPGEEGENEPCLVEENS